MTAAVYIPMAKMLDVWGRAEGFLLMIVFADLGLILMAVSHNLATFCAAQVQKSPSFNSIGVKPLTAHLPRFSTLLVSEVSSTVSACLQLMPLT